MRLTKRLKNQFLTLIDMSKIVDEPIQMLGARHGQPGDKFVWREQEHEIETIGGQWVRRGRWWIGEGCRRYFRVTTLSNIILDLCLDELAHSWTVAEVWD